MVLLLLITNNTTNTTNNNKLLVKPNKACYCMVMDAWAVRAGIIAKQQNYNNNQHNNNNNNNKKNSSSTSSIDETMDKVRGIFQYIKDIHNANAAASNDDNDDNVKPDTAAYTILLSAYANIVYSIYNKDIPYQCEQIFYEMKEHHNSIIPPYCRRINIKIVIIIIIIKIQSAILAQQF